MLTDEEILVAVERLSNPATVDRAIEKLERSLALLRALRAATAEPHAAALALLAKLKANPTPQGERGQSPQHEPPPRHKVNGGDVPTTDHQRQRQTLAERRRQAAAYIAANGPQRPGELASAIGISAGHIYPVVRDCSWFEDAGGRWELTNEGRREALPAKPD